MNVTRALAPPTGDDVVDFRHVANLLARVRKQRRKRLFCLSNQVVTVADSVGNGVGGGVVDGS
jgi:hypothetical protein